jgi:hypothetical protein
MRKLARVLAVETPGDALVLAVAAASGWWSISGTMRTVAWLLGM